MDIGRDKQHDASFPVLIKLWLTFSACIASISSQAAERDLEQDMAALQTRAIASACHNELNTYCPNQPDELGCLNSLINMQGANLVGSCCSAKLHQLDDNNGTYKVNNFSGVNFPEGAELQFDYFCEHATLLSTQNTQYRSMQVAPGPMVFGPLGNLRVARLGGQQVIEDLQLDNQQPLTTFSVNGVPNQVRLSGVSEQDGIKFRPIDIPENHNAKRWSTMPTDLLYQLALGPQYLSDKFLTRLHSNGRVARGNIAEPAVVNGLPLAPGITEFDENGNIQSGQLSQQHLHNDLLLGPGKITFYNNGRLEEAVLAEGAQLNGMPLGMASKLKMDYQGDRVRVLLGMPGLGANPMTSVKVGPFLLGSGSTIELYPNTQVKSLRTSGYSAYREKMYPPNTEIKFAENGDITWDSFYDELVAKAANNPNARNHLPEILPTAEVRGGRLLPKGTLIYSGRRSGEARIAVPSPFKFKAFTLAAGEFSTDENLTIRSASLNKNTKQYNVLLSAYPAKVHFSETGQLIQGTLVEESVIDGIPYSTVFPISFSTEGKVQRGMLAKVTTIHGRKYQANRVISFSAAGTVTEGVLAEDTLIGNVLIPVDSTIKVKPNREVTISSGETISIDGNEYSGRSLTMTEAGKLLQAKLAQDAVIYDEYFEADTKLVFNENGDVVYRFPPSQMDKLRAVSGPTLLVGAEKVVAKHMSSQECEYFIESSKQRKGFWLHGPTGYSLGGSYFKDCIDKTIGLID